MKVFTDEQYYVSRYRVSQGDSITAIAKDCFVDRKTVSLWLKSSVCPSMKKRSPRKATPAMEARRRLVLKLASAKRDVTSKRYTPKLRKERIRVIQRKVYPTCPKMVRGLQVEYGVRSSISTTRRDLVSLRCRPKTRRRVPFLNERDKSVRVTFCMRCLSRKKLLILFSDEKMIDSNDHGCRIEWCKEGEEPSGRLFEQGAATLLLWGVIGIGVKHLIILPRSILTKETYVSKLLQPSLAKLKKWTSEGHVFMQDNARPHCGAMEWLKARGVAGLPFAWPPRSCDLNPIETVWSWLQTRVANEGPFGAEELEKLVRQEWDAIPQSKIDAVVSSYARRCEKVVEAKGCTVKP